MNSQTGSLLGMLTPPSPIVDERVSSSHARKRKRDDIDGKREVLTAKPFPRSSIAAITFDTICTLSRASLPLALLDTANTSTLFPSTNLCQIHPEPPITSNGLSHIWAVRNLATGDIYVLESLEKDVYTAVRLADWVTEDQVRSIAAGKTQTSVLQLVLAAQAMNDRLKDKHSQVGVLQTELHVQPPPPKQPKLKRGALARTAILMKAESPLPDSPTMSTFAGHDGSGNQAVESRETPSLEGQGPTHQDIPPTNKTVSDPVPENLAQLSNPCDTINDTQSELDTLHSRYLETLYTSKASVAYFAKGPLARARAAYSSNAEPPRDRMELAQFYRDSLLPLKKMDTKYKESLLKCIQDNKGASALKPRKSRKRKQKIGKDGMYPDEADFVHRWWSSTSDGAAESSSDAEIQRFRTLSTDLQSRETQMQILIILETMILETPSASPIKAEPTENSIQEIPTKKKQDLKTHLDLLVDKLCIWHTISFDDFDPDKAPGKKPNDKLRDFCSAVIIPFYASKLPVQCKALNKKLGGPSDISPKRVRAPLTKSSSASKVLPGMELKRPRPQSSLQRALTEDISRSRSPSVSLLSREPSERPVSRAGMQARVLQNREVDLVAVAKQQESKMKRQRSLAEQKKELDAAISMLRKPNRDVVAKTIVDEAERRHDGPLSKSSKRSVKSIQVMATPRKNKPGPSQRNDYSEEPIAVPEITAIPSSTVRPVLPSTLTMFDRGIEETPSRGPTRTSNPLGLSSQSLVPPSNPAPFSTPTKRSVPTQSVPLFIESTPVTSRISQVQVTPRPPTFIDATPTAIRTSDTPLSQITNTPFTNKLRMTKSQKPVSFTPLKKTDGVIMDAFTSAPEVKKTPTTAMEDDIYARLGWMDDGFDI